MARGVEALTPGVLMTSSVRGNATRALLLAAVTVVTATGCGKSEPKAVHSRSPTATATPADPYQSRAELLDIGGGRHIYMECAGVGMPTVLLESGDESGSDHWDEVYPALIDHTRACRYDRLGTGQSDPATGCRELPDLRSVLEAALRIIGEKGPFVLVGASGGGYLVAGYAYSQARQIRGIVLVETPQAIDLSKAPEELRARLKCDAPANVERRDYARVENDAWSNRHQIGNIPMTIITNDYKSSAENAEERNNVTGQKAWLVLSPQARQVVVTSGHDVANNEPTLVIREILRVLAAARAA